MIRRYLTSLFKLAFLAEVVLLCIAVGDRVALRIRHRLARRRAARQPAAPMPRREPVDERVARGIQSLDALLADLARQSQRRNS